MSVTITAEQRDALYGEFVVMLTGVDDLWRAVDEQDFDRADQLGRFYADVLTLVVTDLRWGPGPGGPVELKTDPQVVRRVVERLRESAATWHGEEEKEAAKATDAAGESRRVTETCDEIVRGLNGESPTP